MAKTAVCKLMLGRTRDAGWLVYDSSTYAFNELTNSEVRRLILDEGINGLEISSRGEVVLDRRFYLTRNMMARSGVGRYHLMVEDDTLDTDEIFLLTKVIRFPDGNNIYEVVNNKCARLPFKVETVKRLYAEGLLNGATEIDGEIIPCEGVEVEDFGKEGNDADSLSDSWGDVIYGLGTNEACGNVESGQADIPCHVEFDDISDWLKEPEEAEPEAAPNEVETVEEQTKTPKKSSTAKKSKKGAVKSNARAKN